MNARISSEILKFASPAVGIDGCRAGWFFFKYAQQQLSWGISSTFTELAATQADATRLFIDIPIGLSPDGESGRDCDSEARRLLGPRRSSVFSPPCRAVLNASSYDEAKRLSALAIGKKLSKQSYFILPKIKEVDAWLQSTHGKPAVREVHPELAFWALNQQQAMRHNKKTAEGFDERLAVLQRWFADADSIIQQVMSEYPRKHLLRDDIVDALVVLIVALHPEDSLGCLPANPPLDETGIPMEMVFPTPA